MSNKNKSQEFANLTDPMAVQYQILQDFESRVIGDGGTINGNNTATILMEMVASLTAEATMQAHGAITSQFPKRATTSEELFKHLSDYDYIGLLASPSQVSMNMILDYEFIVNNAEKFNESYDEVEIPVDTTFQVGSYVFGIYYPIKIQVNRTNSNIVVVHDTTDNNPLHTLTSNAVESEVYTFNGMKLLSITFPVYQFEKQTRVEEAVSLHGFSNKYSYKDKFYAARIFTLKDGEKIEMHQTMSDVMYDPGELTARVLPLKEEGKVKIDIPQIYFNRNLVGSQLIIEIYTTKGDLNDTDISSISADFISANFYGENKTDTLGKHSLILRHTPTMILNVKSDKIIGGGDGVPFDEFRRRVINNSIYGSVLTTPIELVKYFEDKNFRIHKELDNITDRVYICDRPISDQMGDIVQVANANIRLTNADVEEIPTIIQNADESITILPTTLYKYTSSSQSCVPLSVQATETLSQKSKAELVDYLNGETITRSPFHMRVITDDRYPRTDSFNLMQPTADDITFVSDNISISANMYVKQAVLLHMNDGAGGYILRLGLVKSRDLEEVTTDYLKVWVTIPTQDGLVAQGEAVFKQTLSDGVLVYDLELDTDYHISKQNGLSITSLKDTQQATKSFVNLETKVKVTTLVSKSFVPNGAQQSDMVSDLPSTVTNNFLAMTVQSVRVTFGHSLSDVVRNITDVHWTTQQYVKYDSDVYHRYPADVYEVDADGVPVYELVDGVPVLNKLHSAGEIMEDSLGNPIIAHYEGDLLLDTDGNPIISKERERYYYIDSVQMDLKIFKSENSRHKKFVRELMSYFESYFEVVRDTVPKLLERTELYFKPTRTLGDTVYSHGDGVYSTMALPLKFRIKCYTESFVQGNATIVQTIESTVIKVIKESISSKAIEMTDIANRIKESLSDYVRHIDVLGINGEVQMQTLIVTEEDAQPSIAKKLYIANDGSIGLKEDVLIELVSAN